MTLGIVPGPRLYNAIGVTYAATRRTEPRIAARIWADGAYQVVRHPRAAYRADRAARFDAGEQQVHGGGRAEILLALGTTQA